MCGRAYETYTDEELSLRYLNGRKSGLPSLAPNYNLAPTQKSPVVRVIGAERRIDLFQWQLIPPWEPEFKTKLSTINAKSETVFESRLYRGPIAHHRCIVPLSGFFEWKREEDHKRPFAIYLKDHSIMSIAGVWSTWLHGDGSERHSFAILTIEANDFMKDIHDRMPVILDPKDEEQWLDPKLTDPGKIRSMMRPCPDQWLAAHEVSTLVNSPRNNRPEILRAREKIKGVARTSGKGSDARKRRSKKPEHIR
jgi:putative SOS response-associated peptidase YedK